MARGVRYDAGMEIIIIGFGLGLVVGVIWMIVAWFRMQGRQAERARVIQAGVAGGADPAAVQAALKPASLAELRMWEKHYGLAAMRGLTPDQRGDEIVQLRQRDGI